MTDKKWYSLIIENWSQIAIILGIIGYIIKTVLAWKIKKYEISFFKVQENKINEVKSFYKSYQALRISLEKYINQTEFGIHDQKIFTEIKNEIDKCFIDFDYSCMTVKLFIEESKLETIDEIFIICQTIKRDIAKWHIYQKSTNQPENWDNLEDIRKNRLAKTLPELIKSIEESLRKSYNII